VMLAMDAAGAEADDPAAQAAHGGQQLSDVIHVWHRYEVHIGQRMVALAIPIGYSFGLRYPNKIWAGSRRSTSRGLCKSYRAATSDSICSSCICFRSVNHP